MGVVNENLGSPMKIWGSPMKIWGSPTKIWGSPTKNMGFSIENMGSLIKIWGSQRKYGPVYNENMESYMKIWGLQWKYGGLQWKSGGSSIKIRGSSIKIWGSPTRRPWVLQEKGSPMLMTQILLIPNPTNVCVFFSQHQLDPGSQTFHSENLNLNLNLNLQGWAIMRFVLYIQALQLQTLSQMTLHLKIYTPGSQQDPSNFLF